MASQRKSSHHPLLPFAVFLLADECSAKQTKETMNKRVSANKSALPFIFSWTKICHSNRDRHNLFLYTWCLKLSGRFHCYSKRAQITQGGASWYDWSPFLSCLQEEENEMESECLQIHSYLQDEKYKVGKLVDQSNVNYLA